MYLLFQPCARTHAYTHTRARAHTHTHHHHHHHHHHHYHYHHHYYYYYYHYHHSCAHSYAVTVRYLLKKTAKLPVRWVALEALETGVFSQASDVWACVMPRSYPCFVCVNVTVRMHTRSKRTLAQECHKNHAPLLCARAPFRMTVLSSSAGHTLQLACGEPVNDASRWARPQSLQHLDVRGLFWCACESFTHAWKQTFSLTVAVRQVWSACVGGSELR
jgi:hypothetical protein